MLFRLEAAYGKVCCDGDAQARRIPVHRAVDMHQEWKSEKKKQAHFWSMKTPAVSVQPFLPGGTVLTNSSLTAGSLEVSFFHCYFCCLFVFSVNEKHTADHS